MDVIKHKLNINNIINRNFDIIPLSEKDDEIYISPLNGGYVKSKPIKLNIVTWDKGVDYLSPSEYDSTEFYCDVIYINNKYYIPSITHKSFNIDDTLNKCIDLFYFLKIKNEDFNKANFIEIKDDTLTFYTNYGLIRSPFNINVMLKNKLKIIGGNSYFTKNNIIQEPFKEKSLTYFNIETKIDTFMKYGVTKLNNIENDLIRVGTPINITYNDDNSIMHGDMILEKTDKYVKYCINGQINFVKDSNGIFTFVLDNACKTNIIYTHTIGETIDRGEYEGVYNNQNVNHIIDKDYIEHILYKDFDVDLNIDRYGQSVNELYYRISECRSLDDLINNGNGFFKVNYPFI